MDFITDLPKSRDACFPGAKHIWVITDCLTKEHHFVKNSSQNHVLQGPSFLTNTTICHMFWKTAEFLSETTQTLR